MLLPYPLEHYRIAGNFRSSPRYRGLRPRCFALIPKSFVGKSSNTPVEDYCAVEAWSFAQDGGGTGPLHGGPEEEDGVFVWYRWRRSPAPEGTARPSPSSIDGRFYYDWPVRRAAQARAIRLRFRRAELPAAPTLSREDPPSPPPLALYSTTRPARSPCSRQRASIS